MAPKPKPKTIAEEFEAKIPIALGKDKGRQELSAFIKKRIVDQGSLLDCLWSFSIYFYSDKPGQDESVTARGREIIRCLFRQAVELAGPLNELADFVLYIDSLAIKLRGGKTLNRKYRLPPNEEEPQYLVYRRHWGDMPENVQAVLRNAAQKKRQELLDNRTLITEILNAYLKQNRHSPTLDELLDFDPAPNLPRTEFDRAITMCENAWRGFYTIGNRSPKAANETNLKEVDDAFINLRRVLLAAGAEPLNFYQFWKWIREGHLTKERTGSRGESYVGTSRSPAGFEVYLEACYCAIRLGLGTWHMFVLQKAKGIHPNDRDFLLRPLPAHEQDKFVVRLRYGVENSEEFDEVNRVRRRMKCFADAAGLTYYDEFESVALLDKIALIQKNDPRRVEEMVAVATSQWVAFRDKFRVGQEVLDSFTIIWVEDRSRKVYVELHDFPFQLFSTTSEGLSDLVKNALWRKMQKLSDEIIQFLLAYLEIVGLVVDVISAGSSGGFRRMAFEFIKDKMKEKATDEILDAFHIENPALRIAAGMAANMVHLPRPKFKGGALAGELDSAADLASRSARGTANTGVPAHPPVTTRAAPPPVSPPPFAKPPDIDPSPRPRYLEQATQQPDVRLPENPAGQAVPLPVTTRATPPPASPPLFAKPPDIDPSPRPRYLEQATEQPGVRLRENPADQAAPARFATAGDPRPPSRVHQQVQQQQQRKGSAPPDGDAKTTAAENATAGNGTQRRGTDDPLPGKLLDKQPLTRSTKGTRDPGYPASLQYHEQLVNRYPLLKSHLEKKPTFRARGEPGLWEESVYTGSGRLARTLYLRKGRKLSSGHIQDRVQIDDIDTDGWIVDVKMVGIYSGREIKPPRVLDVVDQINPKALPKYALFGERGQQEFLGQLQGAKENGLSGVRWETNSEDLLAEMEHYVSVVLTDQERKMVQIELVER